MPASDTKNARYTTSTASPRGMRPRWAKETAGLRISAMSAAMMNSSSTLPAAFASAQAARTDSGSATSCTQRGTTTRGGSVGSGSESASSRSSSSGGAACGALPVTSVTCLPPSPEYG